MRTKITMFLVFIGLNVFSQTCKLLVTLNPMDCGNCIRSLESQMKKISKEIPAFWIMEESYKNQIEKLEIQLQIEIKNNVIFSDSLFYKFSKNGSTVVLYKNNEIVFSFPIKKMDNELTEIINTFVVNTKEKTIFQFPDSIAFSKMVKLKKAGNNYLLIDNTHNELTYLSNGKVKQISGSSLFTKELYYNTFKDYSYYDSLLIHFSELKNMAYTEIKFMNATFEDSTIEVMCNFPVMIKLQGRMGVSLSPAILTLNKNLEFQKAQSLKDFSVKKGRIANYYLVPDLFEYYNKNLYFSYMPDTRKKLDKKVYSFASLDVEKKDLSPKMKFLEITFNREWTQTLSPFIKSYIYSKFPYIYNPLLPIEFNLETSTITSYKINDFSINEIDESTKGNFSYADLFHISSIYKSDSYLVLLYRKNAKNFKEIFDLASQKLIYHYQYEVDIVNAKDGVNSYYIPIEMNKFVYLNGKNKLVEVTF